MRVVVCIKQVPDPEAPVEAYALSPDGRHVVPDRAVRAVASTFDENAIEAALQLREQHGGTVTALGLVPGPDAQGAVKRALHMGADAAVLLADASLAEGGPATAAAALAAAVRRIGDVDLVLCGRQAADWDQGLVGVGMAAHLDWPCATVVRRLARAPGGLEVDRLADDGVETLALPLPAVVTVTGELNTPRLTSAMAIVAAQRKRVLVWTAADLGLDAGALAAAEPLARLSLVAPLQQNECCIIGGDTEEEAALRLADRLRELRII